MTELGVKGMARRTSAFGFAVGLVTTCKELLKAYGKARGLLHLPTLGEGSSSFLGLEIILIIN